jgi:hypothetical protein
MSTVLTKRLRARARGRASYRQPSLFGQVVAPPRPSSQPAPAPAPARAREDAVEAAMFDVPTTDAPGAEAAVVTGPTLDEAISELWTGLLASEPGGCPACGSAMVPRHSAAAGVVGGRCTGCSATLA